MISGRINGTAKNPEKVHIFMTVNKRSLLYSKGFDTRFHYLKQKGQLNCY